MKKNVSSKIKKFLTSEAGRTAVRAPLALGVASGALLLSQAVHTPNAEAGLSCESSSDCGEGGVCIIWCGEWSEGTCVDLNSKCFYPSG